MIHNLGEIFKNDQGQDRIIYNDIFFINGQVTNDHVINKLKFNLVEVARIQKSCGKQTEWDPLDRQMSELRLHNINIISKEELITLNQRNVDLKLTDEQIKELLNVQHSLGKILYFDQQGLCNFIIVQPQLLVNIIRSFHTAEYKEWETGTITKQAILKLWSQKKFHQHMPNNDFAEFMIQVLVHLDILVEQIHYRQELASKVQSYLVPCIVKRILPVTDVYVKSADKMICLSYTLLKSSIHASFPFKLIGAAMHIWPLKQTSTGVCLYRQAAILCIDESNELHLLVEDDKVFVYLINKFTKHFIPRSIAFIAQECLTLTMTKILSTCEVSNAFEIKVGEWCTSYEGCYISIPELEEKVEWICKNNRRHQTKYPLYWIYNKVSLICHN